MSRQEAMEQYRAALKSGRAYYRDAVSRGKDPYPTVLEDICSGTQAAAKVNLGTLDIPMDLIVGTLAEGRKAAFAGNFMPLLEMTTEFGEKWVNLCASQLELGITDPIKCYEYMGRFYVQEGHKRVSVMRSYDAPSMTAEVIRVIPAWSEDPAVRAYYEFMGFFRLSGIYHLSFSHPGCYDRIQTALGFAPDHTWSTEERREFISFFWTLREACDPQLLSAVRDGSLSEVALAALELYPYAELKALSSADMKKRVQNLLPDLRFGKADEPTEVSTEPETVPGKTLVSRLIDTIARPTFRIAFVHAASPEISTWSRGHDLGRIYLEKALGDRIKVFTYVANAQTADAVLEEAVTKDGAQLIIATAPTLLAFVRKAAALHPGVKALVCALSVPYAGLRTYYCRIHEAKFISGAIAGALSQGEPIGYIARYPIQGVPAAINAFAMGVRMTNPAARVLVDWSCVQGGPMERLRAAGCRIISGHPTAASENSGISIGWSTSMLQSDGTVLPLASDVWEWGKLYEQIVTGILGGSWDTVDASHSSAVSYWWGMDSGVLDVLLANDLPDGVSQLARLLRADLADGRIHPYMSPMRDQNGVLRKDSPAAIPPEELMRMNWLLDSVEGRIPSFDELLPMSRETTRLLALPTEDLSPAAEKGAAQ